MRAELMGEHGGSVHVMAICSAAQCYVWQKFFSLTFSMPGYHRSSFVAAMLACAAQQGQVFG